MGFQHPSLGACLGVLGALAAHSSLSSGCQRGCGREWLRDHGVVSGRHSMAPGSLALTGVDCPDGLARCIDGEVEISRLAKISLPCNGPEGACTCPWDALASCVRGCVVDGVQFVMEPTRAEEQLCVPAPDAGRLVVDRPATGALASCEEGELFRCAAGAVVDCNAHSAIASCARGCSAEGASIDDAASVGREAAYAILCSR
jgi:hypothetical protein